MTSGSRPKGSEGSAPWMTEGRVIQVEGMTCAKVLRQKHPHVLAEQRRDMCSWEGVKEECGVRGQREGMGACRHLVSWKPLQHPSQGGTRPDFRFNRVTAHVVKNLVKRVKCRWADRKHDH